jgi:hypothetical protein
LTGGPRPTNVFAVQSSTRLSRVSRILQVAVVACAVLPCAASAPEQGGSSVPVAAAEVPPPRCEAPSPWVPVDTAGPSGEKVLACLRRLGRGITDKRVPADQRYELTTFGNPGDEQPVDCETELRADGTWYYAANKQRFPCRTRIRLVNAARTRCVVVQVADTGPHACVEEADGQPTWDVSPLAAKHLFGVTQAGWSENRAVYGAPVAAGTPLGPCDDLADPAALQRGAVGGACSGDAGCRFAGATCLDERAGWPGGHCSADCSESCPDVRGPHASSVCARDAGGAARCLARCDFTLHESGCRAGYTCCDTTEVSGATARVCLPAGAAPPR